MNPYKSVVRSRILEGFSALNRQDATPVLALMHDQVRYRFHGDHALGGERQSKKGVERWFGRLFRLFQSEFRIHKVDVFGAPWDTTVVVHFEDAVKPQVGPQYVNTGVQIAKLRWGKAIEVATFIETDKLINALKIMSEAGIEEASAPPITE